MEKDEAVKLLEKKGYKTIYDHGVPIVLTSRQITKKMYSEIEELLHSNGYASSFGVRGNYKIEETGNYEENVEEDMTEEDDLSASEETEIYESDDDMDDDMDDDIIEDMIEEKEEASMSDLTEIINSDDAVQLTFDSFFNDFDTP